MRRWKDIRRWILDAGGRQHTSKEVRSSIQEAACVLGHESLLAMGAEQTDDGCGRYGEQIHQVLYFGRAESSEEGEEGMDGHRYEYEREDQPVVIELKLKLKLELRSRFTA